MKRNPLSEGVNICLGDDDGDDRERERDITKIKSHDEERGEGPVVLFWVFWRGPVKSS